MTYKSHKSTVKEQGRHRIFRTHHHNKQRETKKKEKTWRIYLNSTRDSPMKSKYTETDECNKDDKYDMIIWCI